MVAASGALSPTASSNSTAVQSRQASTRVMSMLV
jgi:hypothetical protein